MKQELPYLKEWLDFALNGNFVKAQELYYDKLFPVVIEKFKASYEKVLTKNGILFSILGYSPEPIILMAKTVEPNRHFIFTSNDKSDGNEQLEKFLNSEYEIINFSDESFSAIYKCLKEQLVLNPSSEIVIDITGGKKSMVASAAIFGKDYNCKIVYVDFSDYIKELRKPMPGSELLNIVYDPNINQPELFIK